jgi:hypothetical protein
MRILVGIFSALGLVVHCIYSLLCYGASGMSDAPQQGNSTPAAFLLPFIYYGYCLASSMTKNAPSLSAGIVAHLIVIPFCFLAVRDGVGILVVGPLILAPCWFGMYSERKNVNKP